MYRLNIAEWTQDCKSIGTAARRYAHANTYLSADESQTAYTQYKQATQAFANKYGIDTESAERIACIISDSVALGLAY